MRGKHVKLWCDAVNAAPFDFLLHLTKLNCMLCVFKLHLDARMRLDRPPTVTETIRREQNSNNINNNIYVFKLTEPLNVWSFIPKEAVQFLSDCWKIKPQENI